MKLIKDKRYFLNYFSNAYEVLIKYPD